MELRPFYLVNAQNSDDVYAVGLDLGDEAITYRRALGGRQAQFGRHESAEGALRTYSVLVDIELEWGDADIEELLELIAAHNITPPLQNP